jgi:Uncharacterized protein predicted to be involved in DNA repair
MASGLLPSLGIFHRNYYDAFPLADDIMEPYRPFIDQIAYKLHAAKKKKLDKEVKASFLELFYTNIPFGGTDGAAGNMSHLHHSLRREIFHGRNKEHRLPEGSMWVVAIFDFPRHCKSGRQKHGQVRQGTRKKGIQQGATRNVRPLLHHCGQRQDTPPTNRQFNRTPLHALPAERHGQGVPGNLQPLRQHQGSEKMAQIPEFHPIFLIFSAFNRLRTRIK